MLFSDDGVEDVFTPDGRLRDSLFHDEAVQALAESVRFARTTHWDSLRSPHVFMGLLASADSGVLDWGERLGADIPRLVDQFVELFQQDTASEAELLLLHREFMSDNVIRLLRDARQRADDHQRDAVSTMDLLITVFTSPHSIVAECFERIGVTAARLTELAVMAEQHAYRSV